MTSLKRLRFAQNSWIDVERVGGAIIDGTAPDWINAASITWAQIAIGQPVQVIVWKTERRPATIVHTRPLESAVVLD